MFARLGLAVAALAGAAALAVRAEEAPRLDWQLDHWQAGQVQLTLAYRTEHGSSVDSHAAPASEFSGVSEAQLASPTLTLVRFRIHRDAGDFECDGSARAGRASGTCDFHADPAFAGLLKSRGIGPADGQDLFQLAYADIGRAYLDELARQRYPTPALDDLVRAGHHGVTLAYLREMDQAGYRAESLAGLARIRDHGVNVRYVQALKDAGYTRLALDDLVLARDHGVSERFLSALSAAGYRGLPMDEVVRLRDHGVSPEFIAGLRDAGYRDLPAETLVRLRDHGVTASFASKANGRAAADGRRLSPDELVRLRDLGGVYARASARERQ